MKLQNLACTTFRASTMASLALLATNPVLAMDDTDPKAVRLDTVSVTADPVAAQEVQIDRNNIQARQAQTVGDLLHNTPGVQTGHPSALGQRFNIRGLDDRFISISVDGARQEGFNYHHGGNYGIDPELLKQVDIDVGTNSITYDAGSLGGGIHFETVDARDMLQPGESFGTRLKSGYATNGNEWQTALSTYGEINERIDLLGYVNYHNMDKYKAGKGRYIPERGAKEINGREIIPNDGYAYDYLFKGTFHIDPAQYIRLSTERNFNNADTSAKINFGSNVNGGQNEKRYQRDRQTHTLTYGFDPESNDWIDLKIKTYFTHQKSKNKDDSGNKAHPKPIDYGMMTDVTTYGIKARNKSYIFSEYLDQQLISGYEFYNTTAKTTGTNKYQWGTNALNHNVVEEARSHSFYFEDKMTLGKWTITPGVRWDHYRYKTPMAVLGGKRINGKQNDKALKYTVPFTRTYSHISKALGVEYALTPQTRVFATYTELFSGPFGKDLARGYGSNSRHLKPTRGNNKELGVSTHLYGMVSPEDHLKLIAKVFRTDYINFVTESIDSHLTNIPKTRTQGAEITLDYQRGGLGTHLGYAKVDNKIVRGGGDFDPNDVPATGGPVVAGGLFQPSIGDFFHLGMDYTFFNRGVNIGFDSRFYTSKANKNAYDKPATVARKPGYGITDIYLAWSPASGVLQGADLHFGIDNLFDKRYHDHSYYLGSTQGEAEKGRNVKLTLSYAF